jgi:membrane protein DedA with SNARE-associated domain
MAFPATTVALIFAATLVSEDAAALAAASLAASRMLDPSLAFLTAAIGIWCGDIGLYAIGRPLRELAKRFSAARPYLDKAEAKAHRFHRSTSVALFASRFIPGSRLPLYTAAGLIRYPLTRFAAITAAAVFLWVATLFLATGWLRSLLNAWPAEERIWIATPALAVILLLIVARKLWRSRSLRTFFRKYRSWEFWPAWLFYPPVVAICAWHSIRFAGVSLPALANPGQKNGGIVGESKFELLRALATAAPEQTPPTALINPTDLRSRMRQFQAAMESLSLSFPVVLKPDVAQRGAGFAKITSTAQVYSYLATVTAPVLLQRYVDAKRELGIFYYRFPDENRGHIFGITKKEFPHITGDGLHTLRELIRRDRRASLIAETYLARLSPIADRVVPAGEKVRLVEAGNHCQGCIFRDGAHLLSQELEDHIDAIARRIPGFFVGRFDLRYDSEADLETGRCQILELNGAASEATNIYDSRHSLWNAYKTLYRQWEIVYAIGAENRRRGESAPAWTRVLLDWLEYRRISSCYPAAD